MLYRHIVLTQPAPDGPHLGNLTIGGITRDGALVI